MQIMEMHIHHGFSCGMHGRPVFCTHSPTAPANKTFKRMRKRVAIVSTLSQNQRFAIVDIAGGSSAPLNSNVRRQGGMMKFITRCTRCGEQNQLGDEEKASIQVYFHKGTPNTMDRMVVYCEKCGNKHEIGISWFFDINTPNNRIQTDAEQQHR